MVERSRQRRVRGSIRPRGSAFEVRVYAGADPVTAKPLYLQGTCATEREAERLRTKYLAQVDEQRAATTQATVSYLLDVWLPKHEIEDETRHTYKGYIENTIRPALGAVPLAKLTSTRQLEDLYADLRRCGARCDGKPFIEHRTHHPHECSTMKHRWPSGRPSARAREEHDCTKAECMKIECRQHVCKPAKPATIRHVNAVLSAAFSAAVRWDWMSFNPAKLAKKPKRPTPKPDPPSVEDAARIVNAAWAQSEAWGSLVWLCMMLGPRRGELAALRWSDLLLDDKSVKIARSYSVRGGVKREKATKTHQERFVSLDDESVEMLKLQWAKYSAAMTELGFKPDKNSFVFSRKVDHSEPYSPGWLTHRYKDLCKSLEIDTRLHSLRHYSATELIAAGVDWRTVAGRLGHGGGGSTTLRIYAAWKQEADKRAANLLAGRMSSPLASKDLD